jgi:hypothetical protein
MLNILGYKGTANQNYIKISLHSSQKWLSSSMQTTIDIGKDSGEKGTLVHYWWECEIVQPVWKTV